MRTKILSGRCCAALSCCRAAAAQAERLKDLASIAGVRQNQLMGYGLVVGLDGTGDQTTQTPFTVQIVIGMLQQLGVNLPPTGQPAAEERGRGHGHGFAAGVCPAGATSTSPCRRSATPRACAAARS